MARAADLLLGAADRRILVGEDRLTEILATVLQHDRRLAAWFCQRAGVHIPDDGSYDGSTQVWLDESSRPDMLISVRDRAGTPVGRVLSEHKTHTSFRDTQRFAYPESHRNLIGLVRQSEDDVPERYEKVSWTDVAREADRIARAELVDGRRVGWDWRRRALEPEAPSRLRVLHELLSYIERSDVEVSPSTRIEHLDIVSYRGSRRAWEAIEALFRGVCGRLPPEFHGDYEPRLLEDEDRWRDAWELQLSDDLDSWAGDDVAWWLAIVLSPADSWREDGYGEPAFGAGLSFEWKRGRVIWPDPLDPERSNWARVLRTEHNISVGQTEDGYGRCFRTLYLSEVISRGTDMDEQAAFVAQWAVDSVRKIAGLTPPSVADADDRPSD